MNTNFESPAESRTAYKTPTVAVATTDRTARFRESDLVGGNSRNFAVKNRLETTEQQILVGEIDGFAAALNGCYNEMSPQAKAYALELSHSLSKIRSKLAP